MKPYTPIRAIRSKCVECQGGGRKAVATCAEEKCPLHIYRMGKNPKRAGIGGGKPRTGTKETPSQVGSSSPRIDAGGKGRGSGRGTLKIEKIAAPGRDKILRAAGAFMRAIEDAALEEAFEDEK